MAWIESHTNLDRHSKLIRFQTAMRWSRNETVGFLHRFWWSVLEVSPSGDVTALTSPEVMSETLNMKLDIVRDAIQRLEEFGFIERNGENVYVHDWLDYAGRFLRSKFSKKRETLVSIWALHGKDYGDKDETDTQPTPRRNSTDTPPTRTIPNLTVPNQKDKESKPPEKSPAGQPPDNQNPKVNGTEPPKKAYGPPKSDIQKVVAGFKAVLNVPDEDREWDAVYFRRYSRPAADLLRLCRGDVMVVADCIDQVSSALEKKGLSWTPETIVKHAGDWKNGRLFK